jgi:hypothetical protein
VCSPTASAFAQVDFAVSPGGSVTFGTVSVGSFASQTFTLSNTRGGTVSGTVSVSAPFSVASGSPFTLSGPGATQSITARFTPTQPAVSSTNISFSADGDTISRLAIGTGRRVRCHGPDGRDYRANLESDAQHRHPHPRRNRLGRHRRDAGNTDSVIRAF